MGRRELRIAVIGDYDGRDSHVATDSALAHSAAALDVRLDVKWCATDSVTTLEDFDGVFGAPGSPYVSMEGALRGIRFARERGLPYLGTCGGFQHAVMEYARSVFHVEEECITPLSCALMDVSTRLTLREDSFIARVYGCTEIDERFRCQYGLNPRLEDAFDRSDFQITGRDRDGQVVAMELRGARFFVGTLFQPQRSSAAGRPHPLVTAFLQTTMDSIFIDC